MTDIAKDAFQITKISQVTPEVTLFLRGLGFSDYYIIKIFNAGGEAAIALTEDNPYWLLEEFPNMSFEKADDAAMKLGVKEDSVYRIGAAIRHALARRLLLGDTFAPARKICLEVSEKLGISTEKTEDVIEDLALTGDLQMIAAKEGNALYFYGYYRAESNVAAKIAEMAMRKPKAVFADTDAVIKGIESKNNITLSPDQRQAIESSLNESISVITGGPGTGKTTIIDFLITLMEGAGLKTAVAAPTGRAAKRIHEATGRNAATVHRLLEYYYDEESKSMRFARNAAKPLDYDAVIVDETSMMDLMLADALLKALKKDSRLILAGDASQLPSVGAGNVLGDIMDSGFVHVSFLNEIFRQSRGSRIILNAHRINEGKYPEYGEGFELVKTDRQSDVLEKIIEIAAAFPEETVQVITPVKKGNLGSIALNGRLREIFNPPGAEKNELVFAGKTYREGDRIMQIKNNYRLEFKKRGSSGKGIFNGEIGRIAAIDNENAKLTVRYDDLRWAEYAYVQLDEIEHAYAVTVHKSQGSEFAAVIIPMGWFPPVLATRNLIYTAVTRGAEKVIIVGNDAYLNAMIDNDRGRKRNSGLKDRITAICEGI